MIRAVLRWPDPALSKRAEPVDPSELPGLVASLVFDMFQTMRASSGVGLAAPQVGVSLRVIVMDNGMPLAMVNPEIVESSGRASSEEGCLSLPGMREGIERFERVKVRYLDPTGNPMVAELGGREAVIVQHEIDHLDGITMLDRVEPARRRKARREYERRNGRT